MKKQTSAAGFTLVELLVVITILAIISITAYTSFSGSTDKAKNATKIGHISTIETALNVFFAEKQYFPMPSQYTAKNLWGYSGAVAASVSNTFSGTKNGDQIQTVTIANTYGGGIVYQSGGSLPADQIGAKGTMDSTVLVKQYLSQELSDPVIKDIKVGDTEVLKDYGVGEYVYGVYAKNNSAGLWDATSKKGSAYNIAMVLSDDQKGAVAKVSGNFDNSTCFKCPNSLIGSGSVNNNLADNESYSGTAVSDSNTRLAYPVVGY